MFTCNKRSAIIIVYFWRLERHVDSWSRPHFDSNSLKYPIFSFNRICCSSSSSSTVPNDLLTIWDPECDFTLWFTIEFEWPLTICYAILYDLLANSTWRFGFVQFFLFFIDIYSLSGFQSRHVNSLCAQRFDAHPKEQMSVKNCIVSLRVSCQNKGILFTFDSEPFIIGWASKHLIDCLTGWDMRVRESPSKQNWFWCRHCQAWVRKCWHCLQMTN